MWLLLKEQIRNQTKTEERQVSGQVNSYVLAWRGAGWSQREKSRSLRLCSELSVLLISHERDGLWKWGERKGTHISRRPALGLLCQALCVQSISSYLLKQSTSWMINLRFRKTSKLPRGRYESNEPESQMSEAFASSRLPQTKSRDLRCWGRFQPLRQTWPLQGVTSHAPSLALRAEQGSEGAERHQLLIRCGLCEVQSPALLDSQVG